MDLEVKTQLDAATENINKAKADAAASKTEAEAAKAEAKAAKDLAEKLKGDLDAEKLINQKNSDGVGNLESRVVSIERGGGKPEEKKSFEVVLTKAIEEKADTIAKFNRKEIKKFDLELDMKAVGAFSTGNVTGSTVWGAVQRAGIITNPNTQTHVRDLINVLPAGPGTDFYFMRENGVGEGNPANVAEGGTKPQFDLDLVEASVKFETIAGWMLMSRKAMMNIPGLMSYLNLRLPQKLWDVEDSQILYGNGTSPNIKGILTSGNFVAGQAAGTTPLVEKIIKDMSLLEDTYKRYATGIAMRPADYYSFFLNKAAGSGEYDLPQGVTFVNGVLYILGVPVAKTTALTTNDYVVGDFQNGTELYVQEAMRIEFFEQDGTNVRTNQVTVRIEETVALPVYGGDYFVKGSSALS